MDYRVGALHVVQDTMDKPWVDRLLQEISPRLFCEKQLTFADEEVWCVVEDTGEQYGAERFVTVHEFRDARGKPIPYLTEAIVDEMRRRAKDGSGNMRVAGEIARRRNAERRQKAADVAREQTEDIARDFERHRRIGNFAIVPRSQGLRMSRSQARSNRAEQQRAVLEAAEIMHELRKRRARATLAAG